MKVELINVAEYELKEGKTTEIPFETFKNMCGNVGVNNQESLPKVRLFKSLDEFKKLSYEQMARIDQEENIRLLPNGQFLVFLGKSDNKKKDTTTKKNAAANTEENKGE